MTIVIGLVVTLGCMVGGYMAMGGYVSVLWQPWEYVIICGMAFGSFIVANPIKTIKDAGKGMMEAFTYDAPKKVAYLELLGLLFTLMRELRGAARSEVEGHIDDPHNSTLFSAYPTVLKDKDLTTFICDYVRLMIIGNARTHEIEALMDEEINTVKHDRLKAYHAMVTVGDAFPAIGIIAAVLGVIKAMGAIDQSPEGAGWPDRCGAGWYVRRHFLFLLRRGADLGTDQVGARKEVAALRYCETVVAGLHERRHAADRHRIRAQGDFVL